MGHTVYQVTFKAMLFWISLHNNIVWVPQTSWCLPCDDDDDDDDDNDDEQYDKDYDDNDYDKDDDDHHHFIWWQRLYMYVSLKWKKKTN